MIDLNEISQFLFLSVLMASISFVYINILLDAEMVFGGFYRVVSPILDKTRVTRWIKKPLLDCVHCNSGQLSLWMFLVINGLENYNPLAHIGFVSLTILIAHILHKKIGGI